MFRRVLTPLALAAAVTLSAGIAHADTYRYVRGGVHLNARTGPGTGYAKRQVLAPGTRLVLVQQLGNWAQVRTPEGLLLWVFGTYLMEQAPQAKPPMVIVPAQPQPKVQQRQQQEEQMRQQQEEQLRQQQPQPKPQPTPQPQPQPKPQAQQQQPSPKQQPQAQPQKKPQQSPQPGQPSGQPGQQQPPKKP